MIIIGVIIGGDVAHVNDKGQPCGDEVVAGADCEGDWTTTLCTSADGDVWWCDAGVWTNEK